MSTPIIQSLSEISDRYEAMFVDLWGCVHNGIYAFPDAIAALQNFRTKGGKVILVTNAPRPRASVQAQIERLKVPGDAWDDIATSGDSARVAMYEGAIGEKVFHIGEAQDDPFFVAPKLLTNPTEITRVPLDEAEGIACTGLFDPHQPPQALKAELMYAKQKGLKLLCANPDIVVDRGEKREWCAGAVAALYEEMGGESLYFGKPHPPIYDLARRRLAQHAQTDDARILCIGDGIRTDILGGIGEGLDTLFITGGLAADQFGNDLANPDQSMLNDWLDAQQLAPTAAISFLR